MMKFRLLLFVMMFTGVVTNAQEGVKFEDLTFKEALAKAKAENKFKAHPAPKGADNEQKCSYLRPLQFARAERAKH